MAPLPDASLFLNKVFDRLDEINIDVRSYYLDHICYRVETFEAYMSMRNVLLEDNELISENNVNGRPISIFALAQDITFRDRKIKFLELPAPKPSTFYPQGYEHVEFVINTSLESFLECNKNVEMDVENLNIDVNRNVRIKLGAFSVKFHEKSIEEVIREENS